MLGRLTPEEKLLLGTMFCDIVDILLLMMWCCCWELENWGRLFILCCCCSETCWEFWEVIITFGGKLPDCWGIWLLMLCCSWLFGLARVSWGLACTSNCVVGVIFWLWLPICCWDWTTELGVEDANGMGRGIETWEELAGGRTMTMGLDREGEAIEFCLLSFWLFNNMLDGFIACCCCGGLIRFPWMFWTLEPWVLMGVSIALVFPLLASGLVMVFCVGALSKSFVWPPRSSSGSSGALMNESEKIFIFK